MNSKLNSAQKMGAKSQILGSGDGLGAEIRSKLTKKHPKFKIYKEKKKHVRQKKMFLFRTCLDQHYFVRQLEVRRQGCFQMFQGVRALNVQYELCRRNCI